MPLTDFNTAFIVARKLLIKAGTPAMLPFLSATPRIALAITALLASVYRLVDLLVVTSPIYAGDEYHHHIVSIFLDKRELLLSRDPYILALSPNLYYGSVYLLTFITDSILGHKVLNWIIWSATCYGVARFTYFFSKSLWAAIGVIVASTLLPSAGYINATMPDIAFYSASIFALLCAWRSAYHKDGGEIRPANGWAWSALFLFVASAFIKPHGLFFYLSFYAATTIVLAFDLWAANARSAVVSSSPISVLRSCLWPVALICSPVSFFVVGFVLNVLVAGKLEIVFSGILNTAYADMVSQPGQSNYQYISVIGYGLWIWIATGVTTIAIVLPSIVAADNLLVDRKSIQGHLYNRILFQLALCFAIYLGVIAAFAMIAKMKFGETQELRLWARYYAHFYVPLMVLVGWRLGGGIRLNGDAPQSSGVKSALASLASCIIVVGAAFYFYAESNVFPPDNMELWGFTRNIWKVPMTYAAAVGSLDPTKLAIYFGSLSLALLPAIWPKRAAIVLLFAFMHLATQQNSDWQRASVAWYRDYSVSAQVVRSLIWGPGLQGHVRLASSSVLVVGNSRYDTDPSFLYNLRCACRYKMVDVSQAIDDSFVDEKTSHVIVVGTSSIQSSHITIYSSPHVKVLRNKNWPAHSLIKANN